MIKTKMTKLTKSLPATGIALLAILSLASCTKEDTLPDDNDGNMPALALTTLQATDIDVSKATTRAVSTTDYPTANAIGFFLKADAAHGYVACNNRKGEYNAARKLWLPTPDSIWLNSHDADIAVYAPYDAAHTTATTLNLAACLRPADGSKDIWCKHITANNKSKNLSVTLEHVYTRLALTVTRDASYKAEAVLSALSLKGDEIYESATYHPFETTPYIYSTTTGVTPTVTEQTLNASTASATYDLLLIPTPLTGDITLTLTADGKKMEVLVSKDRFTGNKLEAGKQYNVDLTLKPGKLEIASVSLVKWDALPEINGGQAEFEQYYELQMKSPVKIGKFSFATTNLKCLNKVISFEDYPWNSGQLQYNGGQKTDSYWRFGALYSGQTSYQTDQTKLWGEVTGNSALGDPCKTMGINWQVPSKEMLEYLVDEEQIPEEGSGIYINNKLYFFDNDEGMIITSELAGIIRVDKTTRKAIFLPLSGSRGDTSIMYGVGTEMAYWSNTSPSDGSRNFYHITGKKGVKVKLGPSPSVKGFTLRCAYVTP